MPDLVSVVIVPGRWTGDVRRTVESACLQSHSPIEVILADAGDPHSRVRSAVKSLAGGFPLRVVETSGGAPGAQRNAGVRAAAGALIVCLDEGDLLEPGFCAAACERLRDDRAGYAIAGAAMAPGDAPFEPPVPVPWTAEATLGVTRAAPMAVAFRKPLWEAAGGFDEHLPALDLYDFLVRLHEIGAVGIAIEAVGLRSLARRDARYRESVEVDRYVDAVRAVLERHRAAFEADPAAVLFGRERALRELARQHRARVERRDQLLGELRDLTHEAGRLRAWLQQQGRDRFDWGDVRRTSPVSRDWGYDRGKPVDRYYIETFLEACSADVRGVVLEVQENDFTMRYGGARVERSEVVDLDPSNPRATIVDDLRHAVNLASDTYDCLILTQTLHVIDDMRRVLDECRRILKPGGVLLATLPCASRVCLEYGRDGDFWRVTEAGARALFAQVFPADCVEVRGYGNVFVTAAFLYGLACDELNEEEFETRDPYYPLLVGVRAVKPGGASRPPSPRRGGRDEEAPRGAILLYHRVASPVSDVHGLAVQPDHFDEQMAYLASRCEVMPLADLAVAARERRLPARAVAVTFDDGYVDNLRTAASILQRWGLPATFFVSAGPFEGPQEFWWDTLERIFFGPGDHPALVPPDVAGGPAPLPARSRQEREAAHGAIYRQLVRLGAGERSARVEALLAWSGLDPAPSDVSRPMTVEELRELVRRPRCTVGAHGLDHLALPELAADIQRRELVESRRRLEDALSLPVWSFAYPYGAWSGATAQLARECGFTLAVTCDARAVEPGADPWTLPRLEVKPAIRGDVGRLLREKGGTRPTWSNKG